MGYVPSLKEKHESKIVGSKAIESKGGSIRYTLQGEYEGRKTLPKTVSKADFEGVYGFDAKAAEGELTGVIALTDDPTVGGVKSAKVITEGGWVEGGIVKEIIPMTMDDPYAGVDEAVEWAEDLKPYSKLTHMKYNKDKKDADTVGSPSPATINQPAPSEDPFPQEPSNASFSAEDPDRCTECGGVYVGRVKKRKGGRLCYACDPLTPPLTKEAFGFGKEDEEEAEPKTQEFTVVMQEGDKLELTDIEEDDSADDEPKEEDTDSNEENEEKDAEEGTRTFKITDIRYDTYDEESDEQQTQEDLALPTEMTLSIHLEGDEEHHDIYDILTSQIENQGDGWLVESFSFGAESYEAVTAKVTRPVKEEEEETEDGEGLSTLAKVGIGLGALAVGAVVLGAEDEGESDYWTGDSASWRAEYVSGAETFGAFSIDEDDEGKIHIENKCDGCGKELHLTQNTDIIGGNRAGAIVYEKLDGITGHDYPEYSPYGDLLCKSCWKEEAEEDDSDSRGQGQYDAEIFEARLKNQKVFCKEHGMWYKLNHQTGLNQLTRGTGCEGCINKHKGKKAETFSPSINKFGVPYTFFGEGMWLNDDKFWEMLHEEHDYLFDENGMYIDRKISNKQLSEIAKDMGFRAETFEARGTWNLYKSQEKVLTQYRENGGDAKQYWDLSTSIQNKLESLRNSETLWMDVNRWLGDNPPIKPSDYNMWDAENFSAEQARYSMKAVKVWQTISMKELDKIANKLGTTDKIRIMNYIEDNISQYSADTVGNPSPSGPSSTPEPAEATGSEPSNENFEATTGYGYDDPSERMTDEEGWLEMYDDYLEDEDSPMTLEEYKKWVIEAREEDYQMQIKYEQRLKDEGRDMDGNPIKEAESEPYTDDEEDLITCGGCGGEYEDEDRFTTCGLCGKDSCDNCGDSQGPCNECGVMFCYACSGCGDCGYVCENCECDCNSKDAESDSKNLKMALGITAVGIGLAAVLGKDKITKLFDKLGL